MQPREACIDADRVGGIGCDDRLEPARLRFSVRCPGGVEQLGRTALIISSSNKKESTTMKYRLFWTNPATGISGSMNNSPASELSDRVDEAWEKAGEGEVILSTQPDTEVEYS